MDDSYATSAQEVVRVEILPINDEPAINDLTSGRTSEDPSIVFITGSVSDIDFLVGRRMQLNATITDGEGAFLEDVDEQCFLSADGTLVSCTADISDINHIFGRGLLLEPATSLTVTLVLNDLGNIDKNDAPLETVAEVSIVVDEAGMIVTTNPDKGDNSLLIAGPVAGLLAGLLIAAGIWRLKSNSAAKAVDSYFDNFALNMDGSTQTSPIYQGATTGGESALYVPNTE
jgi:hypothetical protein